MTHTNTVLLGKENGRWILEIFQRFNVWSSMIYWIKGVERGETPRFE